jgi:prophage antirepressor-like protein
LYKILFRSRKPIAEKFTNWVCEASTLTFINLLKLIYKD